MSLSSIPMLDKLLHAFTSLQTLPCRDDFSATSAIIERLIDVGVDVNAAADSSSVKSVIPLQIAVVNSNLWLVRLLLAHGAYVDWECSDKSGTTPLHLSLSLIYYYIPLLPKREVRWRLANEFRIIDELLGAMANPNSVGTDGLRPLHHVFRGVSYCDVLFGDDSALEKSSFWDESRALVERLLTSGADLFAKDEQGQRPMDYATSVRARGLALSARLLHYRLAFRRRVEPILKYTDFSFDSSKDFSVIFAEHLRDHPFFVLSLLVSIFASLVVVFCSAYAVI